MDICVFLMISVGLGDSRGQGMYEEVKSIMTEVVKEDEGKREEREEKD